MSKPKYAAFVDSRLERAERALDACSDFPESVPGLADWLANERDDAAEAYAAHAAMTPLMPDAATIAPDPIRRTENGAVPVHRTFGRGTEADDYELLRGAPVGSPVSLAGQRSLAASVVREWSDIEATKRAEAYLSGRGRALTKSQRRRARRNGGANE